MSQVKITQKLKVAMDQCCSLKLRDHVEQVLHHEVVARANQGETDESWLGRGFLANADVYVSRDKACIIFAKAIGKRIICPPADASTNTIKRVVEQSLAQIARDVQIGQSLMEFMDTSPSEPKKSLREKIETACYRWLQVMRFPR